MARLYVFLPDDDLGPVSVNGDPIAALSLSLPTAVDAPDAELEPAFDDEEYVPGQIVERLGETGACLVEVSEAALANAKIASGGSFYPIVHYVPAVAAASIGKSRPLATAWPMGLAPFELVLRQSGGLVVANATIGILAADSSNGRLERFEAVTDAQGRARFSIRAGSLRADTLFVVPGFGAHWGLLKRNVLLTSGDEISVDALDMAAAPDALRRMLGNGQPHHGAGVVVGIIDTGVGPHPDLPNASGDVDSSIGHGTHVAGIVAGRGVGALSGIAPGATIKSYRVFDDPDTGMAANFRIYQAILRAAADGCHLINLSLKIFTSGAGNPDSEPVVRAAIQEAARRGALVFAAAGNDSRKPVAFPARVSDCIAVSAMGSDQSIPQDAYDRWTLSADRAETDQDLFFASFSNLGPEIDLTAPGAGIVSTVPGGGYAPMSGTSMACPAAVGMAARLLSAHPAILQMHGNFDRYQIALHLVKTNARRIGLGSQFEGWGLLQ